MFKKVHLRLGLAITSGCTPELYPIPFAHAYVLQPVALNWTYAVLAPITSDCTPELYPIPSSAHAYVLQLVALNWTYAVLAPIRISCRRGVRVFCCWPPISVTWAGNSCNSIYSKHYLITYTIGKLHNIINGQGLMVLPS